MSGTDTLWAGVVGVGSMGENHVRIYDDLPEATLVGVHDAQRERAESVAAEYDTRALSVGRLLDAVDVVSVAVPTNYHYQIVRECIDAGVDVLVEKPFVTDVQKGQTLIDFAEERGVTLQVGHVERFNPAVQELFDLLPDLEVVAVEAQRLGPPVGRDIDNSAVMDLMVHDIDILLQMFDEVQTVTAAETRDDEYATATVQTDTGEIGRLTASRVTQEKVRQLTVTAMDCRVKVDYTEQSLEICRRSFPEHVRQDESVHYRHENVVERVRVEYSEPLKNEIGAFLDAARTGDEPRVTGEDGLRAVDLAQTIEELATTTGATLADPTPSSVTR